MVDPVVIAAQEQMRAAWAQANAGIAQAVGAILALFVAVGVPLWLRNKEREARLQEDRNRSNSLAIALLPSIDEWVQRLNTSVKSCSEAIAGQRAHSEYSSQVERLLDMPAVLVEYTADLHMLGAMAPALQSALVRRTWLRDNAQMFDHLVRVRTGQVSAQGQLPPEAGPTEEAWPHAYIAFYKSLVVARNIMRITLMDRSGIDVSESWRQIVMSGQRSMASSR
jgi:hypothetical protein